MHPLDQFQAARRPGRLDESGRTDDEQPQRKQHGEAPVARQRHCQASSLIGYLAERSTRQMHSGQDDRRYPSRPQPAIRSRHLREQPSRAGFRIGPRLAGRDQRSSFVDPRPHPSQRGLQAGRHSRAQQPAWLPRRSVPRLQLEPGIGNSITGGLHRGRLSRREPGGNHRPCLRVDERRAEAFEAVELPRSFGREGFLDVKDSRFVGKVIGAGPLDEVGGR